MALALPFLALLLFGILEMGLLLKDCLGLNQAAREAARAASVGDSLGRIALRVQSSAPSVDISQLTWSGWCRQYRQSNGTWDSTWVPLADVGLPGDLHNNAAVGAQVKIEATYQHKLVTGNVLAWLAGSGEPGTITVRTNVVMCRN